MTTLSRRAVLHAITATLGVVALPRRARASDRMPTGFVAHGGPLIVVDPVRKAELAAWGRSMPKPRGIVVATPHYRARTLQVGHVGRGHARYDFPSRLRHGIPDLEYATPSNEALAARARVLMTARGEVTMASDRDGFDHTCWMPLFHMFPGAEVPVVEIAMPFASGAELFALGRALAPLRDEGVLVLGSGNLTHNLASLDVEAKGPVAPWALEFDEWTKKTLLARDVASLLDWRRVAPSASLAHPDDGGHYRVMLVALGAAVGDGATFASTRFTAEGFELGAFSKRCVEIA